VILVNLLPHREAARKRRREVFFAALGVAALIGGLICGAVYSWYLAQIETQRGKNNFLKSEITRLEGQIKDIATLQAEIAALRARQNAVEDLQGNRNMPVYLLSELVKQLPDGVYINSMRQENQTVLIVGVAQSNERVSELLRNLANNSPWLTRPELIEITAGTLASDPARSAASVQLLHAGGPEAGQRSERLPVLHRPLPHRAAVAKPAAAAAVVAPAKKT
jgi:type IV pilus assembly protein PilN